MPTAVPEAVIKKFFIIRHVIAELSMLLLAAALASGSGQLRIYCSVHKQPKSDESVAILRDQVNPYRFEAAL